MPSSDRLLKKFIRSCQPLIIFRSRRRHFTTARDLQAKHLNPDDHFIIGRSGRKWEPVIGLEVHAQLDTKAKLFSNAAANPSAAPNTNVSAVDAAFPGTLPRLNSQCVHLAVTTALALSSNIQMQSSFDRKHYFYGDLPQGYQITQFFEPIARGGSLFVGEMDGLAYRKDVKIQQIQLEQVLNLDVYIMRDWEQFTLNLWSSSPKRIQERAYMG